MPWRIEYTDHPRLGKKHKKILENAVAEAIEEIKRLLQRKQDGGFLLGKTGFSVESIWLPELKKHHIALRGFKTEWVASIVFDEYPTMSVEEVKNTLKNMGFEEHSLYALGATNQKTVAALLEEIENKLKSEDEEYVKQILLINKSLIETFLE
ncbi:MAG: hypothetical protein QW145_02655, partial [Candidatus Bathyarchaeia archaeon]